MLAMQHAGIIGCSVNTCTQTDVTKLATQVTHYCRKYTLLVSVVLVLRIT